MHSSVREKCYFCGRVKPHKHMKHFLLVLAALFTASVAFAQIPELKPVKNLEDALVPTAKKDKWGYANERGKMIIKAVFDEAEPFMEVVDKDSTAMQMARIRIGEGWGYITREGIYLIEPLYDTISVFDSFATVVAKQGPSLILIGLRTGTSNKHDIPVPVSNVLEVNLSEITPFAEDGTAWAKRAGKWGIIDNFGKWIVPCRYDSWSEIASCNGYLVTENGMRSFINRKGEVVIDPGNWTADVEALRKYEYVKWDESLPGFFVSIEDKNDILDPAGNSVIAT